MSKEERLKLIKKNLENSKDILAILGDENRQNILLILLENCSSGGIRVDKIAKKVNLSRPAVSHHLKVLLDSKIVSVNKVGTKNYYHITGTDKILELKMLFLNIENYVKERKEELI